MEAVGGVGPHPNVLELMGDPDYLEWETRSK